jgi:hypothetical protein
MINQLQEKRIVEHAGFNSERRVTCETLNKLCIEGFGTITNQAFIQILVNNNRLPYSALKNRRLALSEEFATKLYSENKDLFPNNF